MEHCTGASKEIKFNITYRDKLLHENITRTVLQKEDSHSDDKTEKQQTPTAAWRRDRKSTRLNSSHNRESRMPSSA